MRCDFEKSKGNGNVSAADCTSIKITSPELESPERHFYDGNCRRLAYGDWSMKIRAKQATDNAER